MQAVRIEEHGDPTVLRVVDLAEPVPARGEVLVRVLGISLNHLDLFVRRGLPGVELPLPIIPGCDGVGQIVATGSGVQGPGTGEYVVIEPGYTSTEPPDPRADHLAPDYRIRGEHCDGLARELVALPARYVFPLPAGVDPVRAAAVPLVFLTAWGMLHSRAAVRAEETVLVVGGASGVGSAAVQLARAAGARVLSIAGSERKRELARELGAEEVFDSRSEDWSREVKRATDGRGVDVVVEHVGPATWRGSMSCLARNGRLVTCGATTGPKVELVLPHVFIKNLSVLGSTMGPRSALPEIFRSLAEGTLRPVVDRVLPLSRVREAHELLESGAVLGKIVLVPGE